MSGEDDCACAGAAPSRPRAGSGVSMISSASQLSEYDPTALTRRMARVNPQDLYHIAVGDLDTSQEEGDCERQAAQAVMKNLPPPCTDHFGHVVTFQPEIVKVKAVEVRDEEEEYELGGDPDPVITTRDYQPPQFSIGQRMRIYASHTFCPGCPGSRQRRLGEEREMDVQAAGGGTFDWEGHQDDQQPIVISEPGDWAPDYPETGSWASIVTGIEHSRNSKSSKFRRHKKLTY